MSKRNGLPKPHARERTIKRWTDPMNRERFNIIDRKIEPSANPDCTAGRNPSRFDLRPKRLAERDVGR